MTGDLMGEPLRWRDLETVVGLDDLPAFHRAFLTWRGVAGVEEMPLRRVGQRVQAELNRMVLQGLTEAAGDDDWLVVPGALDSFAAAQPYLPSSLSAARRGEA